MDGRYRILQVLYDITKNDPYPLQYHCSTREILLRLKGNWQPEYLEELAREKLILVKKSTTVVVLMTEKGMKKAEEFANRNAGSV
jgi:predicted nuclease of restriction endonuclease-like RecB superfamily